MTTIDFVGEGLPHLVNHLAPIWNALPAKYRGTFYAKGRGAQRAAHFGIETSHFSPNKSELAVVASAQGYRQAKDARIIFVNHGVGQTYTTDRAAGHPSYSGGKGRERAVLHLCSSERDAETCRRAGHAAVAVGVAYLDPWHPAPRRVELPDRPTVAFTFHCDVHLTQETRWAFPHFENAIIELSRREYGDSEHGFGLDIVGHGHPRLWSHWRSFWPRIKVPYYPEFEDVLHKADLLVGDNTSTLYEFASTGRPVLVLNAPWYRKDVHHGLRFWDAVPGIQVGEPEDLHASIHLALQDDPATTEVREMAVSAAYGGLCDGHATERAVKAIMDVLEGRYAA